MSPIFKKSTLIACGMFLFFNSCFSNNNWNLYLERPNEKSLLIQSFSFDMTENLSFNKDIGGFHITFKVDKEGDYWAYVAEASSVSGDEKCYLSLGRSYSADLQPYNFDGLVQKSGVYRQSPHEPGDHHFIQDMLMQPVPMISLKGKDDFEIAISNTPAVFDNYTTQTYDLKKRELKLSSGDNGFVFKNNTFQLNVDTTDRKRKKLFRIESNYFSVKPDKSHRLDGIYMKIKGQDAGKLRQTVNTFVSKHWSNGQITDLLGSTFFSTAYMNLRVNETGKSKFWVVPSIEYSNKQYSRDAFWISMVLPSKYSQYCFENEAASDKTFIGAERQLFTIIWAYRNYLNGEKVDTCRVRKIVRLVENRVTNGFYSGFFAGAEAIGCWHGWADLIAFEKDDAVTNNQGLLVTALLCAQKMGIEPKISIDLALKDYRSLFNPKIGAYPLSFQKDSILAVDPLMGDLLARTYLGKALLPTKDVLTHYETMKRYAKTDVGFKSFCNADGSYLKLNQYDSEAFKSLMYKVKVGNYQWGGSWYLYDMLMLMDAYLAGANDAEDLMIWRTKLEFKLGNTTHEYIDTKTGLPEKPNMGWNAAVYGLWSEIMKQGKATSRFFNEINQLGK